MPLRAKLLGGAATAATTVVALALTAAPASADVPDHHHIICQSATFWEHYAVGSGPFGGHYTLYTNNEIGHTFGSGEGEINGWIYSFDFGGPNQWGNEWGWVLRSCVSGG